ncbi:MAG: hypothetical protein R3B99_07415 [Polyangiales bacterium]
MPGLRVIVDEGTEEETPQGVHLEVVGGDRPGIVRQIAGKLAGYGERAAAETSRTGALVRRRALPRQCAHRGAA